MGVLAGGVGVVDRRTQSQPDRIGGDGCGSRDLGTCGRDPNWCRCRPGEPAPVVCDWPNLDERCVHLGGCFDELLGDPASPSPSAWVDLSVGPTRHGSPTNSRAWVGPLMPISNAFIRKHQFGIVVAIAALLSVMVIGTLTSVRAAILVIGALSFLLALWMAAFMGEEHFTPGRDREQGFGETLRDGFSVVRTRPRLRLLVAVLFVLDMGSEAFDRLGHKFFLDEGGWGDDSIGLGVVHCALNRWSGCQWLCGAGARSRVRCGAARGDPACGCVSWRFSPPRPASLW